MRVRVPLPAPAEDRSQTNNFGWDLAQLTESGLLHRATTKLSEFEGNQVMRKQDIEEIYQERTGINCKSEGVACACAVDVPLYKIRTWKLKKQTLGENGNKLETVAYFIQVRSVDNECDMKQVIAASVEVDEFEYKRITRQKQKWLRKLAL